MYLTNKYSRWYYNIINRAKLRTINSYKERHHIIPRSLGGDNSKDNLVDLTAREHLICHRLLTKMTEGKNKQKMRLAVKFLAGRLKQKINVTSRMFESIRIEAAKAHRTFQTGRVMSEETKQKLRQVNLGKKYGKRSPETCQKISTSSKGKKKSSEHLAKTVKNLKNWSGLHHTEETKQKMRKPKSESHKRNISIAKGGISLSAEHKKKLSSAKLLAPYFKCPYCETNAKAAMFSRWHGDNCKFKPLLITTD